MAAELRALTGESEIRDAFDRLWSSLEAGAEEHERKLNFIGGDPGSLLLWHRAERVWASLGQYDNRFLCACGTDDPDSADEPLTIVVALNPAFDGTNRRSPTFFAYDDDSDDICLMHTGNFGKSGRLGGERVEVEWPDGARKEAVEVLRLDAPDMVEQLARFVHAVERHKARPGAGASGKKTSDRAPRSTSREPMPGWVYVARLTRMKPTVHKIGRAIDIDKRLRQYSPKYPYEIEVVHRIHSEDCARLESEMHRRFRRCNTQGEWFRLTTKQLEYLKRRWPG